MASAFLARVQVEKSRHNQDDERFHEDEEAWNKRAVVEKRVRVSDVRSDK
jgi:hypothetical protein